MRFKVEFCAIEFINPLNKLSIYLKDLSNDGVLGNVTDGHDEIWVPICEWNLKLIVLISQLFDLDVP